MMEESATKPSILLRHPIRVLLLGLVLGSAFDALFNSRPLGANVPLFALLVVAGLALVLGWERRRPLAANLWLLVALLFFAVMVAVRDSGQLTFLNVCACLALLALLAVYLAQRPAGALSLVELVLSPFQAVAGSLARGRQLVAQEVRPLAAEGVSARRQTVPILRGLLLAVPVLLIFAALLASADLIFAERIRQVFGPDLLRILGHGAGHVLVAVIVGLVLAGGLAYALRQRRADWVDALAVVRTPHLSGITEASVVIGAVNVLFFLFVLIQIPYLFGGQVNIVPGKFTYAEYARRGFGELVAVAILVLGLLVLLRAFVRRESPREKLAFNVPATILLGLTCVMLASAFKRLLLYEEAYGFTQMRIYPHVFMIWLAALLAWFGACLWLRRDLVAIGVLVGALGFVATLDVLNPDALVVRENLKMAQARMLEPSPRERFVDAYYFQGLSADAVPQLLVAVQQFRDRRGEEIEETLRQRLAWMQAGTKSRQWPSLNLARDRAYRLLVEHFDEGD